MTIVDVSTAQSEEALPWRRFGWPAAILLHLAPSLITFGGALALAPLMTVLGLPQPFALTIAFGLLLTPIELGLLLRAAHRVTGRWSLRALPSVLAYRRPLGRWLLLVPVLFGFALALVVLLTPLSDTLGHALTGVYPQWTLPAYDATTGFSTSVLVGTALVTLLIDGIVNPTVEELYFRGYLLPRLPLAGWSAIPASAMLFAAQHYWQPYNWLLIFVLELVLTTLVVRLRSFRLGIVMHVLANSFGILIGLLAVLS